jgi:hypothetical protein
MQREWHFTDKSKWDDGPWKSEPDKAQWIDAATGLDCLIHRGPSGALCGYVGVPPGHRFHGSDYSAVLFDTEDGDSSYPEVHGGLTFSDSCAETTREDGRGICHIPEPGRPADVWWLGFDCAHSGDLCPSYDRSWEYGTYRDLEYVKREVESLARQLAAVKAEA